MIVVVMRLVFASFTGVPLKQTKINTVTNKHTLKVPSGRKLNRKLLILWSTEE